MLTSYNQQLWVVTSLTVGRRSSGEVENRRKLDINASADPMFDLKNAAAISGEMHSRERVVICHENSK